MMSIKMGVTISTALEVTRAIVNSRKLGDFVSEFQEIREPYLLRHCKYSGGFQVCIKGHLFSGDVVESHVTIMRRQDSEEVRRADSESSHLTFPVERAHVMFYSTSRDQNYFFECSFHEAGIVVREVSKEEHM